MKHAFYPDGYQQGFTLVEIMVAMLLGLFLLGGGLQVVTHSKATYRTQEALSRMQEDAHFAMDFLARDIRMAGFMGCGSQTVIKNTLNTPASFLYRFENAIEGFEATSATAWTPAKDASITSPVVGDSDIIAIRMVDEQGFKVTAHATPTGDLTLAPAPIAPADLAPDIPANTANFKAAGFLTGAAVNNCAIAVVTDCTNTAVFQVSAIAGTVLSHSAGICATPGNASNDLGKTYVNGQVYPINTIRYYIKLNPGNQPALYIKKGVKAEEMIEGIEQMQILYGADTDVNPDGTPNPDGTANFYVTADKIADWRTVVSVRISLLVVSLDDNLTDKPVSYTYNGLLKTPNDRRLRKVFTSTIALRNSFS
jgi:type IV pilus assembly protein PilW